jgi:hypothetical protein
MSRKTSGIRKVTLSSSSASVQVPAADVCVDPGHQRSVHGHGVSRQFSTQTVTLTATSNGDLGDVLAAVESIVDDSSDDAQCNQCGVRNGSVEYLNGQDGDADVFGNALR